MLKKWVCPFLLGSFRDGYLGSLLFRIHMMLMNKVNLFIYGTQIHIRQQHSSESHLNTCTSIVLYISLYMFVICTKYTNKICLIQVNLDTRKQTCFNILWPNIVRNKIRKSHKF